GKRDNVVFSCGVHPLNQDEAYDVEELRLLAAEVLFSGGADAAGVSPYAQAGGKRDNVVFSCGVHPLNQDEAYDVEELRLLAAE
ncbi:hypothetical protein V5H41_28385, partial [Salmonella enterica]